MKTLEETLNYLSKKYSKESGVMNKSDYSAAAVPQLLWMINFNDESMCDCAVSNQKMAID